MTPGRRPQQLAERAEIIVVTDTLVIVAISPDDAATLRWSIEANLPLEFTPTADS